MTALDQVSTISRPSLHEELTDRLRSMIIEGVLKAGEKVPEKALCEKLGVSRTPMREALKVLAADGLLHLEPNKGARVRAITLDDLEEVFPLMGALEALAGELACKNITDKEVAKIHSEHERMLVGYRDSDMPAYFRHNEQIHQLIMSAARNKTLSDMYRALSLRIRSGRYMANMSPTRWQQAVEEHEEMLIALDSRDGNQLGIILKRHLHNKMDTVRKWVESQESEV